MKDLRDILYKTEQEICYARRKENWDQLWYLLRQIVRINKMIEKMDEYAKAYGRNQRKID